MTLMITQAIKYLSNRFLILLKYFFPLVYKNRALDSNSNSCTSHFMSRLGHMSFVDNLFSSLKDLMLFRIAIFSSPPFHLHIPYKITFLLFPKPALITFSVHFGQLLILASESAWNPNFYQKYQIFSDFQP